MNDVDVNPLVKKIQTILEILKSQNPHRERLEKVIEGVKTRVGPDLDPTSEKGTQEEIDEVNAIIADYEAQTKS